MRKKLTAKDHRAKLNHDEWLRTNNVHPEQLRKRLPIKLTVSVAGDSVVEGRRTQTSTNFYSGFAPIPGKKSVFDTRWKKTYDDDDDMARRERVALVKADRLKSRIMPLYNKGPLQLASENEDLSKVGTLSRR